jgi:quinolinate synthase
MGGKVGTFAITMPVLDYDALTNGVTQEEAMERVWKAKATLGSRLTILGHHYQADPIVAASDITGDSLELSRRAAKVESEFIVFCGVHFMAETADMLTASHQNVILPDLAAGCSMADMADGPMLATCLEYLIDLGIDVLPITYVNSSAAVKAIVGRHGGTVCTSTNAPKIVQWALGQGKTVVFVPDQHLGRNTSFRLGVSLEQMPLWDPSVYDGGQSEATWKNARVILWKGHCSVHTRMTLGDVERIRKEEPDRKIMVHPECTFEVTQAADLAGSTSFIINTLAAAEAGSRWAVGTEVNLVGRMAQLHKDKDIVPLSQIQCLCSTMFRIDPWHLMWVLENLVAGEVVNRITVDPDTRRDALLAIERMLELS